MTEDKDICFICGTPEADTRDHVIPACMFSPPLPGNLLTLPAHYSCHNQLDEEYFRTIAAGLSSDDSDIANSLWKGKVDRSFMHNPRLQNSIRLSLEKGVAMVSPHDIRLGMAGIQIERDRYYPTPKKILRGLYRHHTGRYLPVDTTFKWAINEPLDDQKLKLFRLSNPGLSYYGVFECRFGIASDDKFEMSIWWLRFYQSLALRCVTKFDFKQTP